MFRRAAAAALPVVLAASIGAGVAQPGPPNPPPPVPSLPERPPPLPPKPEPEGQEPIPPEPEETWPGLGAQLAEYLAKAAERYRDYAVRFTADETVRLATYEDGEATREDLTQYAYLLDRTDDPGTFREVRQKLKADGSVARGEVQDEESFPPGYAWVFLFSRFHQPYFAYHDLGEHFEGYDLVREIRFRGALPYTDGKDIRQWEGTALVDATTGTPVEIRAEPSRQHERIRLLFDRWTRAFNIIGFRMAPRPFGYTCRVLFRLREDRLSFPTELRYDRFRAVSSKTTVPFSASIRTYEKYRFFDTRFQEKTGKPVSP